MIPRRYEPQALALMRIVYGFLFTFHGMQKVFGFYGGAVRVLPEIRWFAGYLELIGGTLIMIGLFTRPVAFVLAGQMAVAYFMVHQPMGRWPIQNLGEPAVLFCFAYLFLAARGAGAWSLDALRGRP